MASSFNKPSEIGNGRNKMYIMHSMLLASLEKVNLNDNDAVKSRIVEYFEICANADMRPSLAGLALALGITRSYLNALCAGNGRAKNNSELRYIINQAYQILDTQMNDYMQNNDINPIAGAFIMKNNFGYRDDKNLIVQNGAELIEDSSKDIKAIEKKYIESVVEDIPKTEENLKEEDIPKMENSGENVTIEDIPPEEPLSQADVEELEDLANMQEELEKSEDEDT